MNVMADTEMVPACETPTTTSACKIRISDDGRDEKWDQFVANVPAGHHVQTSLWSQVKASLGWRARRIVVTREEEIIAGVQVLYRRIPLIGGVAYVPAGPLVPNEDSNLIRSLLGKLLEHSRDLHLRYIVVQPPGETGTITSHLSILGFQPSSVELTPTASILIDVTPDLCDILARMRRQTRQNITRSERQGMVVREGKREDLPTFCRLNEVTCQRQNASAFPESYFARMWDVLEPGGHIKLFLTEYNGQAVSAMLTIPYAGTVSAKALGWSGLHPDRRPNEALLWALICWSKAHGNHWLDFEGINRFGAERVLQGQPLPEHLHKTPDFFKYGFGGKVTLFQQAYEYIPNPLLRWGYQKLVCGDGDKKIFQKLFEIIRKH